MTSPCSTERRPDKLGERQVPLVVGVGNPMAADDAIGIEVVRRLRRLPHSGCQFLEVTHPGPDWLQWFDHVSWILFIDAVVSGAPPGTIRLIPLPSQQVESRGIAALSSHGLGLAEITKLYQVLGRSLPRLFLLGVEIEGTLIGKPLSKSTYRAMRNVVSLFPSLMKLLSGPTSTLQFSVKVSIAESLV